MKHIAGILAALALLTEGCASQPDGFVVHGFSEHQFEVLTVAGAEYCEKAGRCPTWVGGDSEISIVPELFLADTTGLWVERADDASDIFVLSNLSDRDLRLTILHELGHHWGCKHSGDPADVMWSGLDATAEALSSADIACAEMGR